MRVVTVGTSGITSKNINEMRMANIEVYACVSRDLNRAKEFAIKNNVDLYSDNYDLVLKSPDFDFIYLGLPNSLHYEYAKKALEHGKNVIVEKPICLNQKQTKELLSLALKNRLFVFENMKNYHSNAFKSLKQDVHKIKPIRMVNLNFTRLSSKYNLFKAKKPQTIFSLEYGSGSLMDINCYNVSFAVGLFGLPESVRYICNKQENIDTSGTAVLKYKDFIVNCIASKDASGKCFVDIIGENGHIYYEGNSSTMDNYTIYYPNGSTSQVDMKEEYHFLPVFKDFKNIFENSDYDKYDYYMKLSLMEMKVLDELRKDAGIIYTKENEV